MARGRSSSGSEEEELREGRRGRERGTEKSDASGLSEVTAQTAL